MNRPNPKIGAWIATQIAAAPAGWAAIRLRCRGGSADSRRWTDTGEASQDEIRAWIEAHEGRPARLEWLHPDGSYLGGAPVPCPRKPRRPTVPPLPDPHLDPPELRSPDPLPPPEALSMPTLPDRPATVIQVPHEPEGRGLSAVSERAREAGLLQISGEAAIVARALSLCETAVHALVQQNANLSAALVTQHRTSGDVQTAQATQLGRVASANHDLVEGMHHATVAAVRERGDAVGEAATARGKVELATAHAPQREETITDIMRETRELLTTVRASPPATAIVGAVQNMSDDDLRKVLSSLSQEERAALGARLMRACA